MGTEKENKKLADCAPEELCPVRDIMARFGDKWSVYTILYLGQHGKLRFNELKSMISGISQRMLTVTLRSLEEDGLVSRAVFPEVPPRVEYELTALGRSLLQQLLQLSDWASQNLEQVLEARQRYAKKA
ncbi:HxlR family transcriptional regulator [Pontibacter ummariensis]|uniref:Transcriptional regulator, HxlR family n=1 Tax=Pontibacter ummariensis TaxID=1610492 RepID=A0A239GMP2_9BACT|nr:helix-turn-helix domain-containing protein [Pontibacter ummariensis]PRY11348.1 HxlR family transcriptional regulator [Pontibacter ummariensis]SNS70437.1 transcriptional regulator, HxlR family [Pontibacter ummariensis]